MCVVEAHVALHVAGDVVRNSALLLPVHGRQPDVALHVGLELLVGGRVLGGGGAAGLGRGRAAGLHRVVGGTPAWALVTLSLHRLGGGPVLGVGWERLRLGDSWLGQGEGAAARHRLFRVWESHFLSRRLHLDRPWVLLLLHLRLVDLSQRSFAWFLGFGG